MRYLFVFLLIIVSGAVQAQRVTGLLLGEETRAPLPHATITAGINMVPYEERWLAFEADQEHAVVAESPWKANTPSGPVHAGRIRAGLLSDGSVHLVRIPKP